MNRMLEPKRFWEFAVFLVTIFIKVAAGVCMVFFHLRPGYMEDPSHYSYYINPRNQDHND